MLKSGVAPLVHNWRETYKNNPVLAAEAEALVACLQILGKVNCVYPAAATAGHTWCVVRGEVKLSNRGVPKIYVRHNTYMSSGSSVSFELTVNAAKEVAAKEKRCFIHWKRSSLPSDIFKRVLDHIWNNPEVGHVIGVLELSREQS